MKTLYESFYIQGPMLIFISNGKERIKDTTQFLEY
jgi:hypothetical protein